MTPLDVEIADRVRLLESALECGGQLQRGGIRQVLETLERVQKERAGHVFDSSGPDSERRPGFRDSW